VNLVIASFAGVMALTIIDDYLNHKTFAFIPYPITLIAPLIVFTPLFLLEKNSSTQQLAKYTAVGILILVALNKTGLLTRIINKTNKEVKVNG
jgi:hypothetical protein